jgi:hypothetical protein
MHVDIALKGRSEHQANAQATQTQASLKSVYQQACNGYQFI